ncbi:DUF4188 domain-containing protein [Halothiobacillus sp.]|uniref:monooxygenase family protein n=1 Tax=Halothiobacillus sp. TaxID=1891311 RepID=UPI003456196F
MVSNPSLKTLISQISTKPLPTYEAARPVIAWCSIKSERNYFRRIREPWKRLNRAVATGACVGIWHEIYIVQANQCECGFRSMPKMGLALAGVHCTEEDNRKPNMLLMPPL